MRVCENAINACVKPRLPIVSGRRGFVVYGSMGRISMVG